MGHQHQPPSLKVQGSVHTRVLEPGVMNDSEQTASSRHNIVDAHVNSHRQWQHIHTSSAQVQRPQNPSTEQENGPKVPPRRQEAICNWFLLGREHQFSPQQSVSVHISNTPGKHVQEYLTNTRQTPCFCRGSFVPFWVLLLSYWFFAHSDFLFCFYSFEKPLFL